MKIKKKKLSLYKTSTDQKAAPYFFQSTFTTVYKSSTLKSELCTLH